MSTWICPVCGSVHERPSVGSQPEQGRTLLQEAVARALARIRPDVVQQEVEEFMEELTKDERNKDPS